MLDHQPPDLSTRAGRKAWRHEMRMVAVWPRRWGLWLLAIGALLLIAPSAFGIHNIGGWSPVLLGLIACLAALPLLVASAVLRRRYVRGRLQMGETQRT
ncbi:hypothetical protein MOK15_13185 [Sphingobium sp. BYY-5]|uniref:hypothetical protein n=1 Tax=Sphingobium sp. BYY-5 TaxID=2926400 RepID=UPI001FA700E1|nr:hypothetical protein [Sphingobium sp. BYY-5]MCI4591041.1 hypothetical protein [Sphingobium sp. BYY-5]